MLLAHFPFQFSMCPHFLPAFFSFLLLFFPTAFAPGPSRENKLFIECAVRAPKGRHGPETIVSHSKMGNNRIILFGLGGNLYAGNSELSDVCKEDKEFFGTSRMAPKIKQGSSIEKCENNKLTLNGRNLTLTTKKYNDYEQCFAGQYELFECPEEICAAKSALFFIHKNSEPKAKSYAFVFGGKILVNEVTMAKVSTDQLDCVKKVCSEESVPLVEEAIRWSNKKDVLKKMNTEDTAKFKVYKECAVKRRRVGTGGKSIGTARMETLMAHVKMDKLVLFFGMGGHLYAGESILAGECEEDKLFTRSKLMAMRATLLGCHKSSTESGTGAKLSFRKSWRRKSTETNGIMQMGSDQIQMEVNRNSETPRGSQCHAQHNKGNGEQYYIYKCPREQCAGKDRLLLISSSTKKGNSSGKLVSGGQLLVQEVLFADVTPKQWQCVRQICGPNVLIPTVEAVMRKQDKSAKRHGTLQRRPAGQRRRNPKRMGRKPSKNDGGGGKAKTAAQIAEGEKTGKKINETERNSLTAHWDI